MIKKDTVVLLISTAAGIGITTVLSFFIVWIGFPANNPQESFKDALEFSVGLFGGLATFGAAVIAAHLFNDWRHQHNKTVEKEMAWFAIQKFDAADSKLSRFQDDFQNFSYRCNFISEMPDDEFQNLDNELNSILSSIRGLSLDFSSFLEAIRKYSIIAEKQYFDNISNDVKKVNHIIFNTQNHRAHFPGSMGAIADSLATLKGCVEDIEEKYINEILKELKSLT